MKTVAFLWVAMWISANALAESENVKSVSLYEPPKSTAINPASARATPNSWTPPACLTCEDVAHIQTELTRLGYKPGRIDGIIGPNTMAAIKTYQSEHDLPTDGQATEALLELLENTN